MTKPYVLRKDLTLIERETGREIGRLELVTGSGADRGWRYVISWGLHPAVDGGFHRRYEAAAAAWGAFNAYMSTTSEPRTTAEWWERLRAAQ